MHRIEVKILNNDQLGQAERMMVAMARLTQRSHKITNMADFTELLNAPYSKKTAAVMAALPHPTIQKFALINIAIVGASRRFLAQITRHQNEIKFMSGSLQYSDYSDDAQFCVPYEVIKATAEWNEDDTKRSAYGMDWPYHQYINSCRQSLADYRKAAPIIGNDAAGYMMPQGMRNVLLMSVLPFELMHIINQRACNRNTLETQYVMLKIWEALYNDPEWATMWQHCGPDCQEGSCREGKFCCGNSLKGLTPTEIIERQFPYLHYLEEEVPLK